MTYLAVAAVVGGGFIALISRDLTQLQQATRRYSLLGLSLALLATTAGFFIQVALFAERGISGLWHWGTAGILWNTSVGTSMQLRLAGLLLALALCRVRVPAGNSLLAVSLGYGLMVLLLSSSFAVVGHTVQLPGLVRVLLAVHLVFVAGWIGSLWLLLLACSVLPPQALLMLMYRFSRWAMSCVPLLGLAGVVLAYLLLGSVEALVTTSYGQLLLVKLMLFMLLLTLAAVNKYRWLPALEHSTEAAPLLARSVRWELWLGLVVLGLTALLSGLLGPELM